MKSRIVLLLVAALFSIGAQAQEFSVGDLRVIAPYATPTPPGAGAGAAYATLENKGKVADKLLRASSPKANIVELHEMKMQGDVMKMAEVPGIELKPGQSLTMRRGSGYHLMFMQLKEPFKVGEIFPVTLEFEKAGKVEIKVKVQEAKRGEEDPHKAHKH
jgi:periplasmic copper chaperone A